MLRFTLLPFLLLIILFSGCGGGGTSGAAPVDSGATPQVKILAAIQSGGATEFSLNNGSIVFSDYNRGEVLKVSSNGGEIQTLYANSFSSPGKLVYVNGKVFVLNTQTAGGIFSLAENSTGVSTLVQRTDNTWAQDISYDGTYIYWSSGSNVYRTRLTVTPSNSVETIFSGSAGRTVRMALDSGRLYITDSANRKLLRINTSTLDNEALLSFSGTPSWDTSEFDIPLTIDKNYIYALVDNRYIHRIDKSNQQEIIIPATFQSFYNVKIISDNTGMYWWDQSVVNQLSLKKKDTTTGNIITLLTIPFIWNLDASVSDGVNVYWFEHEFSSAGDYIYKIKRVSINGGNAELVATYTSDINISGALLPRAVAFDADSIYWSSMTTNLICKLSKSGGAPETVTRFDTYSAIIAIDGFILAANNGNVTKIPINGETPGTSEWSQPSMSSSIPTEMTNDDSNLYWAVQNAATATDSWGTFDIYSKPMAGGTVQKIATIPGSANRLYPYSDILLLVKSTSDGGAVSVIPKAGGDERVLVRTKGFEPSDLQIVGNIMYLLAEGVRSLNLDTGEAKTLVQQNSTKRIYVDGANIYWTQAIYGGGGGLYTVSITGGTVQKLYNGPSWKITGDDSHIYWATGFQILSMEK